MREDWEKHEEEYLAPWAAKSKNSRRLTAEEPCPIRSAFQRDRDRIIHSKAFRRLKHKTQVFIAPQSDHFRTRLTHTLEVSQISRTIARALFLNEDLVEAIALGHDLGHTPFGHAGERSLELVCQGFSHNLQSLRVVDHLERGGQGLNLTEEVRDGILHHSGDGFPATLEGWVVRLSDRIAYINHDIDDSLGAGLLSQDDLPKEPLALLGVTHSQRINSMVMAVIEASSGRPQINMSEAQAEAMDALRNFLFEKVYMRREAQDEEKILKDMIIDLYQFYMQHPRELPDDEGEDLARRVCDYIAGMTDYFALFEYERIFGRLPSEDIRYTIR